MDKNRHDIGKTTLNTSIVENKETLDRLKGNEHEKLLSAEKQTVRFNHVEIALLIRKMALVQL
jgi:hypothetical protein